MPDGVLMKDLRGEFQVICESRGEAGVSVTAMESCVGWKGNTLSVFSRSVGLQAGSRKEHGGFLCLRILVVDV